MKSIYVEDMGLNVEIESTFMIKKVLYEQEGNLVAYIGDKTGDLKASIPTGGEAIKVGEVLYAKGIKGNIFEVSAYTKQSEYDIKDFLPVVKRPIEDIMKEMEQISKDEFTSTECRALNEYFFGDQEFVRKFKDGIGGLSQHHAYLGGLAEHTLNVMYMTKNMAYRYDCKHKEIAILAAKLHDIGKIQEYNVNGPFSVTMRGEMEGHIVIGIGMIEEAFNAGGKIYSEEFQHRIKGCIVQHHGKVEYGSPKAPNTEEAFIVHFADYIDATLNKVWQVKEITKPGTWSEYDRRIGTRLFT